MTDTDLAAASTTSEPVDGRAGEPAMQAVPRLDEVRREARAAIEKGDVDQGTHTQRIRAAGLAALSWLACRLPEGPQIALADLAGRVAYRTSSDRSARARRNLARVVQYLATTDMADARIRAAATDPRALERLLRAAYRHHARYYLEILRAPGLYECVSDSAFLFLPPASPRGVDAPTFVCRVVFRPVAYRSVAKPA